MAKTKFFRIAVEGATVDGREIERQWIEEMAASYDPATYAARINCEHIAGYSPEKPFNAYGTVVSLKAEEIELNLDGKKQKRLALYAEIDANDQLKAINKADQKLFTSCEIHPNFAGTGKKYLVGLAVTDNPASLGTEPLKFAAMSRPNLFTTAEDVVIELDEQPLDNQGIVSAITAGFASLAAKFSKSGEAPKQGDAPTPANDNSLDVVAFSTAIGEQVAAALQPVNEAVAKVQADFAAMQTKLASTENQGFKRQPASGGNGEIATDC